MKRMPNIELSDKELELIIEDGKFNYGGEAVICRNNNPHSLFKIFTHPGTFIADVMPENKHKKVKRLYERKLDSTTQPLSTISNRGKLIGYEISYDIDDETLFDLLPTDTERLEYLRQTREVLRYLASQDVTYGDVKDDNILINKKTGKVKFCDIDNMQVGDLPIDVMGYGLAEYYDEVQTIDEKADAYMHNLMFLEQLKYNGLSYRAILNRLAVHPLMPEFPDEVVSILETLSSPQDFKGEYAIEYMKKR